MSAERVSIEHIAASEKYALNGGPFGSKLVGSDYVDEGVPVIRGVNLARDRRFSLEGLAFVSEHKANQLAANAARPGDVVFTQRGTLGQVGIIPKFSLYDRFVISQSQMKLTVDQRRADANYVYYYFRHPRTVRRLDAIALSSGVPHINLDILRKFEIDLPPLPTQQKIAAILSAYDDLIENNTRRIAILQDMARLLYREWFIDFRFPGHESVRTIDSPLGPIPDGWQISELGKVADTNAVTLRPASAPDTINYVDIKSVSPGRIDRIEPIPFRDAPGRARRAVSHGDIIWSSVRPNRRSYGLILFPQDNLVVSTGFTVITARQVPYSYLYHAATTDEFVGYIVGRTTGAAYPAVTASDFESAAVLLPPADILDRFHDVVGDMLSLGDRMLRQNGNLSQTRDLLLPRLISGEIDVEDLDINTEGLAA